MNIEKIQELVDLSKIARDNAYVPESKFPVGAAILTKKGVFTGGNIENSSYSLCMCAERTALFAAVNAGCRKGDFIGIAVIANTPNRIVPCGACLQTLSEFVAKDMPVVLANKDGHFVEHQFKDLLPIVFDINDV